VTLEPELSSSYFVVLFFYLRGIKMASKQVATKSAVKKTVSKKKTVEDGAIDDLITGFELAAHREPGIEFWLARDLQPLLGYESSWQNFLNVIHKAKIACEASGYEASDHFNDVIKMVSIGSGAERESMDIELTRYACYLIAQNGDARKKPVAFAQTYFAIQTRRQELQDDEAASKTDYSEDQKRLILRNDIKSHNLLLASAAKQAGVIDPRDYAIFQNFGYQGLYGGLDRSGIQRRKGLPSKANILDHMGSTELAANLFRATQAEDRLTREKTQGKNNANTVHFEVGQKVRRAIKSIGGVMPEALPQA
jgi:DNA-damage-inducible protein D